MLHAQNAKVQPVATYVAWSVCLLDTTMSRTKKQLNRSRCCLDVGLGWAQGTMLGGGPNPPRGTGNLGDCSPHWNALECVSSKCQQQYGVAECVHGQCISAKVWLQNRLTCHRADNGQCSLSSNSLSTCCCHFQVVQWSLRLIRLRSQSLAASTGTSPPAPAAAPVPSSQPWTMTPLIALQASNVTTRWKRLTS